MMSKTGNAIEIVEKMRDTVEVLLDDGTVINGPRNTPVGDF